MKKKKSFENENYVLLTEKYIDSHQMLQYICANGHKHHITWGNWNNGHRCPFCYKQPRKYEINEYSFEKMSPEAAYWLGFIAADGCVSISENGYRIIICLNKKDIDMLVAFKNAINSTRDIKMIGRSKAEFRCNSKYMVNALKKYGITPRKTFTMEFSNEIPNEYYSGFIRGYFDGDGTIYFNKKCKPYRGIVATKAFLEKVQEIIMNEVGLSKTKIRKKGKMYELRYIGSNNIKAIREWLYKGATVYMKRKKERMDSIK